MPVLERLQLPKRQKYALIGVFALGGLYVIIQEFDHSQLLTSCYSVCIISILRLSSLHVIATSTDPTYDNAPIAYWTSIESNVAIICACLPSLRGFLTTFFKGLLGSGSNADGNSGKTRHGTHRPISFVEAVKRKATGREDSHHVEGDEGAYVELRGMGEGGGGLGASAGGLTTYSIMEERLVVEGKV